MQPLIIATSTPTYLAHLLIHVVAYCRHWKHWRSGFALQLVNQNVIQMWRFLVAESVVNSSWHLKVIFLNHYYMHSIQILRLFSRKILYSEILNLSWQGFQTKVSGRWGLNFIFNVPNTISAKSRNWLIFLDIMNYIILIRNW